MPQLNPDPWFFILTTSWSVYLLMLLTKISTINLPNKPVSFNISKMTSKPWTWPWA
uniref:ATP synthase complex subunit 8 n=1 Tax=Amphiuma means TaxID=8312 RepID=C9DHC5_AMPME|nr:ATP synthase F0 subunit 8 [Amphiuma means]